MFIKNTGIFILFYCLLCVCKCQNAFENITNLENTFNTEDFFENLELHSKRFIRNINNSSVKTDINSTSEEIFSNWTKWSSCRKCKKIRRKFCISKKCKDSILKEVRSCRTPRCKRKNRRKATTNIIHKLQVRNLENDDYMYKNWSDWTVCSSQCVTWRQRYCKWPGTCPQNPDIQMAYCYRDNSACHVWINNMLNQQSKYKKKTNPSKCGIPYRTKKKRYRTRNMLKILGGKVTKHTKWPWHVAILNHKKTVFCGGTLISPSWILTAGHCLRSVLYVRLNEFNISHRKGDEIEYKIHLMIRHNNFNKSIVDNDIALLKLPKKVSLPYACLPKNIPLPTKHMCTVVGWGKTSPYHLMGSKYLKEAQIPIVPKAVCKRSYRFYHITENMFCAGYKNGGIDTCSGDSGGGLMCPPTKRQNGWTVQGITSFGEGCGKKGKYGIYTDVRKYLTWISTKINKY